MTNLVTATINALVKEERAMGELAETQTQRSGGVTENFIATPHFDGPAVPANDECFTFSTNISTLHSDSKSNNFCFDLAPAANEVKEVKKEQLMGSFAEDIDNRFGFDWSPNEELIRRDMGNESDSDTVVYSPLEEKETIKNEEMKPFEDLEGH